MPSAEEVQVLSKELIAAMVLIFILAAIIGGAVTGSTVGDTEQSTLQTLMSPFENFVRFKGFYWINDVIPTPIPKLEFPWLSAAWNVITLDLALFDNVPGGYIKLGLWCLLGVSLVMGIGMWLASIIRRGGG